MRRWSLSALLCACLASPAHAFWHLWTMTELYSNADGTVQYLEMTALAGAQQFVLGHGLVSRSASHSHEFVFPADLPGDTTGARMLVATQGFASLGIVTPDYIVPNGFFHRGGGGIDFLGADQWDHGALPTDGRALQRDGALAPGTPENFAGRTGAMPTGATAAFDVQGLWWRAPAASESGWGLSLTLQGEILFAAWFTYGADGRPTWLVATDARRGAANTYSGTLYRTAGPAFDSVPFDPARVSASAVGSATWSFADACNGTFSYTVDGITQTKAITRQVFAAPGPACR